MFIYSNILRILMIQNFTESYREFWKVEWYTLQKSDIINQFESIISQFTYGSERWRILLLFWYISQIIIAFPSILFQVDILSFALLHQSSLILTNNQSFVSEFDRTVFFSSNNLLQKGFIKNFQWHLLILPDGSCKNQQVPIINIKFEKKTQMYSQQILSL